MTPDQLQATAPKNLTNGRIQTATEEMLARFAEIKDKLPDNWLDRMLAFYPVMRPLDAKRLIYRLKNIYAGNTAPTSDELKLFHSLCA